MKKRLLCGLLSATLLFSILAGCAVVRTAANIAVTVLSNAEKAMREDRLAADSSPILKASLAKNEQEGMQFILNHANQNFKVKNVTVSDLTLDDKSDTITSDNIKIYRQHYMYVDVHYYTYTGHPDGWYPDALIEMKYDLAHYPDGFEVAAGQNQGYWLTVGSAAEQKPGVYKGLVTVETDLDTLQIPVECTVYDFAISDQVHFKSYYALRGLDSYDGQKEQYYRFLESYRLTPANLPIGDNSSDSEFLDAAQEFATPDNITAYFLNLMGKRGYVGEGENRQYRFFDNFIRLTNQLNQITPGKVYAMTHDEPRYQYGDADDWTEEVEWFTGIAMRDLKDVNIMITHDHLLPTTGTINPITGKDEGRIRYLPDAWCIKPSNTVAGDVQDLHKNGVELWWYTCNWPVYPAINTHIDSPLIGARTLSWMEYDYDIDGYFCYAATSADRATNSGHPDANPWINPYAHLEGDGSPNTAASDPAGDGYIAMIGLEGDGIIDENVPVPTIRLEALRDGMEDYEYLYIYEQKLRRIISDLNINLDPDKAMKMFYDALYNDTADYFQDVEKLMFTRNDLANKICEDVDFIYYITAGSNDNFNCNERTVYVYTDGSKPVSVNGVPVDGNNGKYKLKVNIDETQYRNDFTITVGDQSVQVHCFPDKVNKQLQLINFDAAADTIIDYNEENAVSVNNGQLILNCDVSDYFEIPAECLPADIKWSDYTHLRMRLSDETDKDIIDCLYVELGTTRDSLSIKITPTESGDYIDIPLSEDLHRIFNRYPLQSFAFLLEGTVNKQIAISDLQLINKDFQDPALRKYLR